MHHMSQSAGPRGDLGATFQTLQSLVSSSNQRKPQADISNAPHLFGDPDEYGDVYGDPDSIYGDPFDPSGDPYDYVTGDPQGIYGEPVYGDVSEAPIATYQTLIGEPDREIGTPFFKRKGVKMAGLGLAGAAATAATALGVRNIVRSIQRRRQRVNGAVNSAARYSTISAQTKARRMMGKIPSTSVMPFYSIIGATLNQYPLSPTEMFPAEVLKWGLNRQATETPFESDIAYGTYSGSSFTVTANGTAANRLYPCVFLTIGINALQGNPGTIFTVTGTFPTITGTSLVVSSQPWSFTFQSKLYARFVVFPWQLVTNKPLLVLGQYSNSSPITMSVSGIPSTAAVNLLVPGSQHVWTIGLRNRLN